MELEIREGYGILDISSASAISIIIEKPDNTLVTKTGIFVNDGKDGLIYCNTVSGDLDQAGSYNVQARINMPTFIGYSTVTTFTVYPNLPIP